QFSEFASARDQRVGGNHTGTACVGQDGQAIAARTRLLGQHVGHEEYVGDAVDPQYAAAPERRSQHFVSAGQRSGMRRGGLGGGGGATCLDHDDGLGQRN